MRALIQGIYDLFDQVAEDLEYSTDEDFGLF